MTLDKLLEFITGGGWGIILFLSAFIEIPKIKLNLWQLLFKAFNKPLLQKMDEIVEESKKGDEMLANKIQELDEKLQSHITTDSQDKAILCRQCILETCDNMNAGREFSKESWAEIMRKIDAYEAYCIKHPEFRNSLCTESIRELREAYHQRECRHKK